MLKNIAYYSNLKRKILYASVKKQILHGKLWMNSGNNDLSVEDAEDAFSLPNAQFE